MLLQALPHGLGIFPDAMGFRPPDCIRIMVGLRNLTEKVRWVHFFGGEFSVKLKPCYVMLIPTLRATLRQLFLGMVKTAFYSPGSWKSREHSLRSPETQKISIWVALSYTSLRSLLHFKRSVADQYRGDTISVKGPSILQLRFPSGR